ncbi:MAG: hypothetical protein WCW13_00335 [archaeon]|jgi:tRNA(Ser,Leu) C12 N-acetylase TAN1
MFEPNCVVLLPFPEIVIKGPIVRAFMEKRLIKNMRLYFEHFNVQVDRVVNIAGRMVVHSTEPEKVISSLKSCFGISVLFLSRVENYSDLNDLCVRGVELCKGHVEEGAFAVRGKSFSKAFGSKELEMEFGGKLLEAYPKLKVKLKDPVHEVFCIAFETKAYFYFAPIKGASGMPTGVQGRAALLITKESKKTDLVALGKNLLKTGCTLAIVSDEKKIPNLDELAEFNCFKELKTHSVKEASEFYALEDIKAFFSTASTLTQAEMDSKLVGVKVFAPLLF